jgi:hypothetical protein
MVLFFIEYTKMDRRIGYKFAHIGMRHYYGKNLFEKAMDKYEYLKTYFEKFPTCQRPAYGKYGNYMYYDGAIMKAATKSYLENLYENILMSLDNESEVVVNIIFEFLNLDLILPRLDCGNLSKKVKKEKKKIMKIRKKEADEKKKHFKRKEKKSKDQITSRKKRKIDFKKQKKIKSKGLKRNRKNSKKRMSSRKKRKII